MDIQNYLSFVFAVNDQGNATEHSYRAALQYLFDSIDPDVVSQNEPQRLTKVGAPDFSFHRADIPVGHCEAKILGADLHALKGREKEQLDRYRKALPNLIYTNCLDFLFYRDGELVYEVSIGEHMMGWQTHPDQFAVLEHALQDFAAQRPQTITSSEKLAKMMAGKAVLIKDILGNSLREDADLQTELAGQYKAFKEHLIHDITPDAFADIYAETVAYGMFAARMHDPVVETFSRQEALEYLPKSNPFLRSLFGYIAGQDLDDRLRWIIDDLAKVFQACDLQKLMANFGSLTKRTDPFIHFYEDFLKEYNPAKRKARGVWYTPEPVVNFIVRAVDEVLQKEFGLPMGLADTSKVTVDWDTGQTQKGKAVTIKKEVHRVQILDPATGTGTFLAEVIKQIAPKIKGVAEGMWSGYIEKDLIPRLHGFELLMASYAMCHMKLDMMLGELGYKPTAAPPRLGVYLTNSLEEGDQDVNQNLPFSQWLSREAKGANTIKRDMPIMCVIGNPPYLSEAGKSEGWIGNLMEDYKKEPGGHEKLREENSKAINNSYAKFIRMSSHLIEKNGEGILGFITDHGYLDNPTFRGMRWHLLKTFDKIWVLDLHGNANKSETTPGGEPDANVFDIKPGVAIIVAIKKSQSSKLAKVTKGDFWGTRASKYERLNLKKIEAFGAEQVEPKSPSYILDLMKYENADKYNEYPKITDFFVLSSTGVKTHRDHFAIDFSRDVIAGRIQSLRSENVSNEDVARTFKIKDTRDWKLNEARKKCRSLDSENLIAGCLYRPFDLRWCIYGEVAMDWPREEVMDHLVGRENFGLNFVRPMSSKFDFGITVSNFLTHQCSAGNKSMGSGASYLAPLYLYPDEQNLDQTRRVNFDPKLYKILRKLAKHSTRGEPDEVQTFDYIYGVLHCPGYRDTYKEFLKIDFPRIPWPITPDEFWDISAKGKTLRELHLMQPAAIGDTPFQFKGDGDNTVEKPHHDVGKVWINKTQYFDAVPAVSWDFYIGGYQPAQKWLKDRKGRELTFDDILHYQKIIKILAETDRIMKTIEMDL